ncbi:excalibur calcium-binding domain-containing protein [Methylobacter sp. BlB1]|nr:excalibur calcium-binding domain-containing protein [Methylobacter sp. BlB1]
MKLLPTIALSLFSLNVTAAYKCIVDGKTVYSSSKCAQDAQQFSVDKDSDWTMKLKTRTSPQEDARLNAIGASPKSNEPEKELPPKATVVTGQDDGGPSEETEFNCDGRDRCSQMTSCEEATFFLKNCPNQQTDGDNNGIPCEKQWCNDNTEHDNGTYNDSDNGRRKIATHHRRR